MLHVFRVNRSPLYIQLGFTIGLMLFVGIPAVVIGVNLIVGAARKRTSITASPEGLTVERRTAWRTRITCIPSANIVDVDCSTFEGALESARRSSTAAALSPKAGRLFALVAKLMPTKGVVVKTHDDLIALGQGLPASELRYLTAVLRRALAGVKR
jgi:hypothetical protein